MDIEKAKEILDRIDIKFFLSGMVEQSNYVVGKADEINIAIETVLSELEKKDKIINEMAVFIDRNGIYMGMKCKDDVIDHFTKKVEEDENNN